MASRPLFPSAQSVDIKLEGEVANCVDIFCPVQTELAIVHTCSPIFSISHIPLPSDNLHLQILPMLSLLRWTGAG